MGTPWVSFDGKDCSGCKYLNERGYCEFTACIIPCTVRATIPEVKPQTHADRVRSMSDEELAEFMWAGCDNITQEACKSHAGCVNCWLDWLREAKDED